MAIVKWSPVNSYPVLSDLFDDFFNADISDYLAERKTSVPAVNIKETEKEYQMEMAAPGMKKENFKVKLENDVLTVVGEKEVKEEENTKKLRRKEFNYSSFQRSFFLPENINSEKIEATYTDGILLVSIPKKDDTREEAKSKQINIS